MENANGNKPGGQRRNPGPRRWYGYMDVVAPMQPLTKPAAKKPSAEQQRSLSGVAERVESLPPQSAKPATLRPEIWPASPVSYSAEKPVQVRAAEPTPIPAPARKPRTPKLAIVLYVLASLLFVTGGFIAWQGFWANRQITQQITQVNESAEDDGSNPATTPVTEDSKDKYVVAPDLPRVLTIEKLGVKARIMPLGVTSSSKLKAPNNIYDVGWYNASSRPGQPGAMLMDGHVSSWESDGVFKNIKKLVPGDEITVERGDGQLFRYRVVKSQAYDEAQTDMRAALQPVTDGKNGLNLITCYGRVRPGTSEFEQRLIVFAEQI